MASSSSNIASKEHFWFLDGLRGLAAIFVCMYHFYPAYINGWIAVDFFFLLSGFVIAHSYERQLRTTMSLKTFINIRLIRLYPVYILTVTIGFLLWGTGYLGSGGNALSYIFHVFILPTPSFLQSANRELFPMNLPAWSVYLEIVINIIYASLIIHLTNRRLLVANIIFLISLVWGAFHYGSLNIGPYSDNWLGGFIRIFWGFFVGVALCRVYQHFDLSKYNLPLILALAIIAYLTAICLYTGNLAIEMQLLNAVLIFPLVIIIGSLIKVRSLLQKMCKILGQLSYPLYLSQFMAYHLTIVLSDMFALGNISNYRLLVSVIVAFIILFFYDIPVRNYLTKKLRK